MTCPGGLECSCTFQTMTVWPQPDTTEALRGLDPAAPDLLEQARAIVRGMGPDHAYDGGLPVLAWWDRAILREFEGAATHTTLRVVHVQFVAGEVHGDDWLYRLPLMAAGVEPSAYGYGWRADLMDVRMGRYAQ